MSCCTYIKETWAKYEKYFTCKNNIKLECYWVGGTSLVWGAIAVIFDWIETFKPLYNCDRCFDADANKWMSLASAILYTLQLILSAFMIYGIKHKIAMHLFRWLWCQFFFVLMHISWSIALLPIMPTVRGTTSLILVFIGIHYFGSVRELYSRYTEDQDEAEYVARAGQRKRWKALQKLEDQRELEAEKTLEAEKDDELPQVVCLKPGDISQEEYDKYRTEGQLDDSDKLEVQGPQPREEEPSTSEGKILFRPPAKRSNEDGEQDADVKKCRSEEKKEKRKRKEKERERQKRDLLSFDEDEEEQEIYINHNVVFPKK